MEPETEMPPTWENPDEGHAQIPIRQANKNRMIPSSVTCSGSTGDFPRLTPSEATTPRNNTGRRFLSSLKNVRGDGNFGSPNQTISIHEENVIEPPKKNASRKRGVSHDVLVM